MLKYKAQGKEWAKYPFGVMKEDEDRKKMKSRNQNSPKAFGELKITYLNLRWVHNNITDHIVKFLFKNKDCLGDAL